MSVKNPYQVLGVSETATQDDIKNAYRKLAKKLHPDLNPGSKEAETRFKEVSSAYEMIGTPEMRAKYDRGEFREGFTAGAGAGPGHHGPFYYETQGGPGGRYSYSFNEGQDEDLFESLFGAKGRGRSTRGGQAGFQMPGEDQIYEVPIELRDAIHGTQREIQLPNGKRLQVKIPKGVHTGTKLRFAGQGSPGIGGAPAGDLYVQLNVRTPEHFRQEGDDLVLELPITLSEAVLGGQVRVPTADGAVMMKIPPKANSGMRLRLHGKGAFSRTGQRGDQIVVLTVVLPPEIDSDLEEAIRRHHERSRFNPREKAAA